MRANISLKRIVPVVLLMCACTGKQIVKTEHSEKGLPEELAKAFEVKDLKASAETETKAPTKEKAVKAAKTVKKTKPLIAKAKKGFVIPNRRPKIDPLWVGEKVWMDVSWLNTTAGEFLLEVNPFKELNGRKVYDIKGSAKTSSLFSLVYKAEDWVQSFVDFEGWFPYKFVLHGDETRYQRKNLELFDHAAKQQYVWVYVKRLDKDEVKDEKSYKDLVPLSQDSLSALYYARAQAMEIGKEIRFPMTTQGKQWETSLIVQKREEIKTRMGYIRAIKTKVETRFNGVLKQRGDAFIWFSDDDRKFVLKFEAKVKIGWVEGIAKQVEFGTPPADGPVANTVVPYIPPESSSGIMKSQLIEKLMRLKD